MIELPYWAIVGWVIGSGGVLLYLVIRDTRRLNAADHAAWEWKQEVLILRQDIILLRVRTSGAEKEVASLQAALDRSNACANDLQDKLHLANKEIERLEGLQAANCKGEAVCVTANALQGRLLQQSELIEELEDRLKALFHGATEEL